jgi:hypothetical protein
MNCWNLELGYCDCEERLGHVFKHLFYLVIQSQSLYKVVGSVTCEFLLCVSRAWVSVTFFLSTELSFFVDWHSGQK